MWQLPLSPYAKSPRQYYDDASRLHAASAFAECESSLRNAISLDPRFGAAWTLLGITLERLRRPAEALHAYNQALTLNEHGTVLFTRRSLLEFRKHFGLPTLPRPSAEGQAKISILQLGNKGRFGNQLFQYAFARLYANEYQLEALMPDWIGRDLFDLDDPLLTQMLPRVNESEFDFFASLNRQLGEPIREKDISGYFLPHTKRWGNRVDQFQSLFEPGKNICPIVEQAVNFLKRESQTIIAVHIRRGDFGEGQFWIAPTNWYVDWLRTIWHDAKKPLLYVATDDDRVIADFADFSPLSSRDLPVSIPGAEFYLDHYVLSRADFVAISNSSFSFTATMLNKNGTAFVRPEPTQKKLVPFDPWNADVLIDPSAQ